MTKRILILFLTLFVAFGTLSCSEAVTYDYSSESGNDLNPLADETTPERKIVYEVDARYDVGDLEEADAFVRSQMAADEWFDREVVTATQRTYVARIKTERLDAFVAALRGEFTVRSYSKVGTDISLDYDDAANRVLALEAQLARLLELYDAASIEEMIAINAQIADIEVELQDLNGELNRFDSLVEYSEVTIVLYGSSVTTSSPFVNRFLNAFVDGFEALVGFLDGLLIVIAIVAPFLISAGIVVVVVWLIARRRKTKGRAARK
ncbi:MAG: DUF4349 domain-containing protein [Candidatus Izemoplasmatales bacterium]